MKTKDRLLQLQADTGLKLAEPQVTLLAKTEISDAEFLKQIEDDKYPSYTPGLAGGEYLVEFAGRQCYESFHNPAKRTTDEYIANILKQRHYSVLEHANVTFAFQGISRTLTHELVRHRHFSFSQLSQRYVDSTQAAYVCPPFVLADQRLLYGWFRAINDAREQLETFAKALDVYYGADNAITQKQKREAVRSLVPNAVETKIVVTGNCRSWREFLEKRWSSHADAEISRLAGMVRNELLGLYPSIFSDIAYE